MDGPVDGLLDVAVVKDDVRALAAELEGDALEVGLCRGLHDLAADERATSEGELQFQSVRALTEGRTRAYLVDVHVRAHGRADGVTIADDEVDDEDNRGLEGDDIESVVAELEDAAAVSVPMHA